MKANEEWPRGAKPSETVVERILSAIGVPEYEEGWKIGKLQSAWSVAKSETILYNTDNKLNEIPMAWNIDTEFKEENRFKRYEKKHRAEYLSCMARFADV